MCTTIPLPRLLTALTALTATAAVALTSTGAAAAVPAVGVPKSPRLDALRTRALARSLASVCR